MESHGIHVCGDCTHVIVGFPPDTLFQKHAKVVYEIVHRCECCCVCPASGICSGAPATLNRISYSHRRWMDGFVF